VADWGWARAALAGMAGLALLDLLTSKEGASASSGLMSLPVKLTNWWLSTSPAIPDLSSGAAASSAASTAHVQHGGARSQPGTGTHAAVTSGSGTAVSAGSAQNLPYGTALAGSNATAWAQALLRALGAPLTSANVSSLTAWFRMEGGGGANNPLNTTLGGAGATGSINSVGVKSFSSPAYGIAATVRTLEQSNFSGILAALRSGRGLIGNSSVGGELSSWSGGGYSSV